MVQTVNNNQTEKTIHSVYSKIYEIFNESYREREKNGEFQHPMEIDECISKEYYVKYIQQSKWAKYTLTQFFNVIHSISSVGKDSPYESYYSEFNASDWCEDKPLSEEQYSELVNIIFELGNK